MPAVTYVAIKSKTAVLQKFSYELKFVYIYVPHHDLMCTQITAYTSNYHIFYYTIIYIAVYKYLRCFLA